MQIDKAERNLEFRLRPLWRQPLRATIVFFTNAVVTLGLIGATKGFEVIFEYIVGRNFLLFSALSIKSLLGVSDILILILFFASTIVQTVRILVDEK